MPGSFLTMRSDGAKWMNASSFLHLKRNCLPLAVWVVMDMHNLEKFNCIT